AHDFVDLLGPGEFIVCAGLLARAVNLLGERTVEDVVDEGAFAAAAHACNNGHHAKRNAQVNILKIVLARPGDAEPLAGELTWLDALQHGGGAAQITAGERC